MRSRLPSPLLHSFSILAAGALAFVAGCYDGQFDPDASGVFLCASNDECPEGQECFNGVCLADEGPALTIQGPEPFQLIAAENTEALSSFTVTIRGSDLVLTDSNQAVEGEGYISLMIDGMDVTGRIVVGDLATGLTTDPQDLSAIAVGPHRLRVRAFYGNGEPYLNPSASTETIFFIDDGTPQVAIVEPRPGQIQATTGPMAVTIAAINWTWNSAGSAVAEREGHTHTYSLPNYPACLTAEPSSDEYCNFKYLGSFSGAGDPANPILLHGEITPDNLELLPLGPQPFQAGLQDNEHEPFPSPDAVEFDEIMIELVAG